GDDIYEDGLPLTLSEAAAVSDGTIVQWGLDPQKIKDPDKTAVNRFIRSLIRWELATRHLVLVNAYDVQTAGRVDNIRTGVTILDKAEYELLRGLKAGFGSKLNRFNNAEASPDNMQIAVSVLLLDEPWKFYRASFVGWSDEAVNIFAGELAKTDK